MAAPDLEQVPCPVCGAAATRTLVTGDGWAMGRCVECRLFRQHPRLTAAALRASEYDVVKAAVPTPRRSAGVARDGLADWESKPREAYLGGVEAVEESRDPARARGLWI